MLHPQQPQMGFTSAQPLPGVPYRQVTVTVRAGGISHGYPGWFHTWAVYSDKDGSAPYAIIEDRNGEVHCVGPSEIKFDDSPSDFHCSAPMLDGSDNNDDSV